MIQILRGPHDKSTLILRSGEIREGNEIKNGTLTCKTCDRSYPIVRYVPRFVENAFYAESFSFERELHRNTQMPNSGNPDTSISFHARTGFSKEIGKDTNLVLDAGCGVGRYMSIALELGAEVVGMDLSSSVDQAM